MAPDAITFVLEDPESGRVVAGLFSLLDGFATARWFDAVDDALPALRTVVEYGRTHAGVSEVVALASLAGGPQASDECLDRLTGGAAHADMP